LHDSTNVQERGDNGEKTPVEKKSAAQVAVMLPKLDFVFASAVHI
jgi:hypothetical protein